MEKTGSFQILGLMSGSSLDGLDLAHCHFEKSGQSWKGEILKAHTFPFPEKLESQLRTIRQTSFADAAETEAVFVRFCAESIGRFISKFNLEPMAIASHGHTVFHKPAGRYTLQIGNGGLLSGMLNRTVVSDFRTLDVGNGGQGAPLVPGAEHFLFSDFDVCLNLGGIANVSFPAENDLPAFDIVPCNQLLNLAASWCGLPYDKDGFLADKGVTIPELLHALDQITYYRQKPPKSLGNEDVFSTWIPLMMPYRHRPEDVSHTLCLHIASRIANEIKSVKAGGKLLVTGGGAFHNFFMACLRSEVGSNWHIPLPSAEMIGHKEAYCFAFLGLLRLLEEKNVFRAHTGAKQDLVSGAVYGIQWLKW